jgi:hypothetical protein
LEKRTKKLSLILVSGRWAGMGRMPQPAIWKDAQLQKPPAQSQKKFFGSFFQKRTASFLPAPGCGQPACMQDFWP